MNVLKGIISNLTVSGNISLVDIEVEENLVTVIVIETPESADYLVEAHEIYLRFKETEVILAHPPIQSISIPNQLPAQIIRIYPGVLLSKLELRLKNHTFHAIIITSALQQMALKEGDYIVAMIKVTEIMLSQN